MLVVRQPGIVPRGTYDDGANVFVLLAAAAAVLRRR